ncbi:septation protein IspZ [Acinetobacter gerneri]|uniref:Inner membrane-spanning protein YciB n=1 Tax=Acinetobacter gerneri DSM 14967 = CIP 107464 = MTCC 9824 TaxID=1120926 RepID=N8YES1_9GAMM|nr:septation protein IspZ [Acinetobacter gerneri]ENV35312.1 intracellular septation protein A [Acinetobacter gerneri DSM 14967 = CIP 107464 = MTCC 9824]EPR81278.1 Intracellular septation protein IspA [Acinetobacter gerneri DSM 14967 = CIP 107464 = MTCC 9824]
MKAFLDYLPIIIFFLVYKLIKPEQSHAILERIGITGAESNQNILVATLALMVATFIIYSYLYISQKFKLEKAQLLVVVSTIIFGGLTIALRKGEFMIYKAIFLNLAFSLAFMISPMIGKIKKPLIQRLFDPVFELSYKGWLKLNWAWVGMFCFMAFLHFFFGFIYPDPSPDHAVWVNFTAFGDMIVMFSFIIIQFILLRKHFKTPQE